MNMATNRKTGSGTSSKWCLMPATVLLIGAISIVLVLWTEQISRRLHIDEMLIDAVSDVQTHVAMAHLRLEEVIRGEHEVAIGAVKAELDQAIRLADVILNGGEAENNNWIPEPLKDAEMRVQAEAVRDKLIKYRELSEERLLGAEIFHFDLTLYQLFHSSFSEALIAARQLEDRFELDEEANQKKSRVILIAIPAAWAIVVTAAGAGLWNREKQRKRSEQELTRHREHLSELVSARTAELSAANEHLRSEIGERKQAETALKNSEQQLRSLSARLMTAQESERRIIARELHDELGHALTIVKLRLKSLERELRGNAEVREDCEDIMGYIDQTIENVRRLSRDLSPAVLEDLGLTAAIRWLVDNFDRNYEGTIELDIEDIDHLFPEDSRIVIYRVLQEALTNIGKHAEAKTTSVVVKKSVGRVTFSLQDDGKGFRIPPSFSKDSPSEGLGLAIMEERVRMLGGILEIQTSEGKGTRTTFSIPSQEGMP